MEACEVSASMAWARLMRGSSSSAKLVTLRSRSALMASNALYGCRRPTTTEPSRNSSASAGEGGSTLSTTSAAKASAGVSTTVAAVYSSSRMRLSWPARRSINTSAPRALYLSATAGTSATRVSPVAVSLGTPMRTAIAPPSSERAPEGAPRFRSHAGRGENLARPVKKRGRAEGPRGRAARAGRQAGSRRTATDTEPRPTCVVRTAAPGGGASAGRRTQLLEDLARRLGDGAVRVAEGLAQRVRRGRVADLAQRLDDDHAQERVRVVHGDAERLDGDRGAHHAAYVGRVLAPVQVALLDNEDEPVAGRFADDDERVARGVELRQVFGLQPLDDLVEEAGKGAPGVGGHGRVLLVPGRPHEAVDLAHGLELGDVGRPKQSHGCLLAREGAPQRRPQHSLPQDAVGDIEEARRQVAEGAHREDVAVPGVGQAAAELGVHLVGLGEEHEKAREAVRQRAPHFHAPAVPQARPAGGAQALGETAAGARATSGSSPRSTTSSNSSSSAVAKSASMSSRRSTRVVRAAAAARRSVSRLTGPQASRDALHKRSAMATVAMAPRTEAPLRKRGWRRVARVRRTAVRTRAASSQPVSLIHISEPTRLGMISYAV